VGAATVINILGFVTLSPLGPPSGEEVEGARVAQRAAKQRLVGITLAALFAAAVVGYGIWFVFFAFRTDPWRARVVSVDGSRVCTVPDRRESRGFPYCGENGLFTENDVRIQVRVGQCFVLQELHPIVVLRRKTACA
jgi:hypothetical protein